MSILVASLALKRDIFINQSLIVGVASPTEINLFPKTFPDV
jgi:hypothetical protein